VLLKTQSNECLDQRAGRLEDCIRSQFIRAIWTVDVVDVASSTRRRGMGVIIRVCVCVCVLEHVIGLLRI
jgi:hypothetical protein